jgi:hypothetical protein
MPVTFSLTGDGEERTMLRVVETGLERLQWPDNEKKTYIDQHRQGWQTYGDKLQALSGNIKDVAGHGTGDNAQRQCCCLI